ncbi:MAG: hypothetical protein WBC44_20115 [Planctomycetaceae bacterium]
MLRTVTSHRLATRGVFSRCAGLSILTALAIAPLLVSPLAAQQPDAPPDAATVPPETAADPAEPSADVPTEEPAAPPAAEVTEPAEPAAEEAQPVQTGPKLPDYFTPPPAEIPEVMTLRNPLMTDEEIKKEDDAMRRYGGSGMDTVFIRADPTNENKEAMRRWAKLRIAQMTAVKEWRDIRGITTPMMISIRNAGRGQSNSNRQREFREALCAAMVEACKEVLDNNFHVRLQAVLILGQLDVVTEELVGRNRKPPEAYVPAVEPLLDVLASEDQPPAVKVAAAYGVGRIGDNGVIPADLKFRAGDILTAELAKPDTFWWYQVRLAEALAAIELDYNQARQPIVIEALLAAIADDSRHCLARSAAAKALSRTRAPAGALDEKAAADRLVQLARDMSLAYNKSTAATHWHECYWNLYVAFRPADQDEVSQLPNDSLLRRGSLPAAYEDAFQRILPVVKHVFTKKPGERNQPIPQELLQRLNEPLAAAPN